MKIFLGLIVSIATLFLIYTLFYGRQYIDETDFAWEYSISLKKKGIVIFYDKTAALDGHMFADANGCRVGISEKCIIFYANIIFIPEDKFFKEFRTNSYEGVDEGLNLKYKVTKEKVSVFNEILEGYRFNVSGLGDPSKGLRGDYFYTKERGVVFFTSYYSYGTEVKLWSRSYYGMFAKKTQYLWE